MPKFPSIDLSFLNSESFKRNVLVEKIQLKRKPFPKFAKRFEVFISDMNSYLDNTEFNMERDIIKLLENFQIHASVKSEKRSLPYQHEIIYRLPSESYIQGMFEYHKMFRCIVKELLNEDCHKIRFYMHIEPYGEDAAGFQIIFNQGIEYKFRYFKHKLSTVDN